MPFQLQFLPSQIHLLQTIFWSLLQRFPLFHFPLSPSLAIMAQHNEKDIGRKFLENRKMANMINVKFLPMYFTIIHLFTMIIKLLWVYCNYLLIIYVLMKLLDIKNFLNDTFGEENFAKTVQYCFLISGFYLSWCMRWKSIQLSVDTNVSGNLSPFTISSFFEKCYNFLLL